MMISLGLAAIARNERRRCRTYPPHKGVDQMSIQHFWEFPYETKPAPYKDESGNWVYEKTRKANRRRRSRREPSSSTVPARTGRFTGALASPGRSGICSELR